MTAPERTPALVSLLEKDAVPMATLQERYGAILTLVEAMIGVVPNSDAYLEIWPPAFRSYNVMVPNLLNLPPLIWGLGAPRADCGEIGLRLGAAPQGGDRGDVFRPVAIVGAGLGGIGRGQRAAGLGVGGFEFGALQQGQHLAGMHGVALMGEDGLYPRRHFRGDGDGVGVDHALHLLRRRARCEIQPDPRQDHNHHQHHGDDDRADARRRPLRLLVVGSKIGRAHV